MMTESDVPWYWRRVNLFDGLKADVRKTFLEQADVLEYRKGQVVMSADDPGDRVFFLARGMVKIYHLSAQGNVSIFWFCVPGDLFGAGGITGSAQQAVFGQAVSRSLIYALPRPVFEQFILTYPQLGLNVIKLLGARLRLACDAVTDQSTLRTETRLARVLLRQAREWEIQDMPEIRYGAPITHQELANMVGACRQTVNRHLKQFEKNGWLRFDRRIIVICDAPQLKKLADMP